MKKIDGRRLTPPPPPIPKTKPHLLQGFSQIFRTLFPGSSRLACEFNARITPVFFEWLVGPATVEAAEVVNPKTYVGCEVLWGGWVVCTLPHTHASRFG